MREYERPTSLAACCAVMYGKGMATSRCSNHSVAYRCINYDNRVGN